MNSFEKGQNQLDAMPDNKPKAAQYNGSNTPSVSGIPFYVPSLPGCDSRDGKPNTRPLTELGNTFRMMDKHGHRMRYIPETQSWIIWNDAWSWDTGSAVRSMAGDLRVSIYLEGAQYLDDGKHFIRWANKSQESKTINAVVFMLSDQAQIRLPLARIDADPLIVGFNQARMVIDLRTGSTRAATPADYVTKALRTETVGNAADAVLWLQFLDQIFDGDRELIAWMQIYIGYLLTGSTAEQIFLFLYGSGANGKSVFVETLKYILGDYSRAIASETLSETKRQAGGATPDLAALIGARMVVCSETEDGMMLSESLVKSLVSGDTVAVRELYRAPVQFIPNFKLIISGNHKPIIRGHDHGIWRRTRLIPFNRTFSPEERDPHLLDKLKAEAPHILAWAVAGCIEWQRRGLADTPAAVSQATDGYMVDQDVVGRWLEECTTNSYGRVATGDLYANYENWCKSNGIRQVSNVVLGRRLAERGYTSERDTQTRYWCGLTMGRTPHLVCTEKKYKDATDGS